MVVIDIILTLFVSETVGKPMQETIKEIEDEKLLNEKDAEAGILTRGSNTISRAEEPNTNNDEEKKEEE